MKRGGLETLNTGLEPKRGILGDAFSVLTEWAHGLEAVTGGWPELASKPFSERARLCGSPKTLRMGLQMKVDDALVTVTSGDGDCGSEITQHAHLGVAVVRCCCRDSQHSASPPGGSP